MQHFAYSKLKEYTIEIDNSKKKNHGRMAPNGQVLYQHLILLLSIGVLFFFLIYLNLSLKISCVSNKIKTDKYDQNICSFQKYQMYNYVIHKDFLENKFIIYLKI